ncbi:MAG: hypothetical protein K8T26_11150 [Lentisphaerae bacterium]|nr:hypothetical protein [Lentisphaerota bacterium]
MLIHEQTEQNETFEATMLRCAFNNGTRLMPLWVACLNVACTNPSKEGAAWGMAQRDVTTIPESLDRAGMALVVQYLWGRTGGPNATPESIRLVDRLLSDNPGEMNTTEFCGRCVQIQRAGCPCSAPKP